MVADLARGVPSIVCMHYDRSPRRARALSPGARLRPRDGRDHLSTSPRRTDGAYKRMARARFLELWPLKYRRDDWTVIRFALEPGRIDVGRGVDPAGVTPAAHVQHVMKTKAKIPDGYATRIAGPFFVIGDEAPARVEHYARDGRLDGRAPQARLPTCASRPTSSTSGCWGARQLRRQRRAPVRQAPVDAVRLLPARAPGAVHEHRHRRRHAGARGRPPVHRRQLPVTCPAWFNEGLASLYEAVREQHGQLWGLPNWRLAGLQARDPRRAAADVRAPDRRQATTRSTPRRPDTRRLATSASTCRRRGCFTASTTEFHAAHAERSHRLSHAGPRARRPDMARFEQRWQAWALALEAD